MLKLILAQLGLTITQEQVETAMREAKAAYDAVQDMKASQLRCEAMLKSIIEIRERSFGEVAKAYADDAVPKTVIDEATL